MKKYLPMIIGVIVLTIVSIFAFIVIQRANKTKDDNAEGSIMNIQEINNKILASGDFDDIVMQDLNVELLKEVLLVNVDNVEEVVGKYPAMNTKSSMYVIIKAKNEKVNQVKDELNEYAESYEKLWSTYLPGEYEIVKNRQCGNVGNYVYLIISKNAVKLKDLIQ